MKKFLDEGFLLQNKVAEKLYAEVKDLPIIDYHCHLNPQEIADNKKFKNITEMWLGGDHYKWRLMRANGVDERYVTGDAPDYEKFEKWCETIEECIGSPLYHWTHLELRKYFNYDGLLSKKTAKEVWETCNKMIASDDFTVWKILEKFNVTHICTTDDPADSLEHHIKIRKSGIKCVVLPTLRPSNAMNIEADGFCAYVAKLSAVCGRAIKTYADMIDALYGRIQFFHEEGCRLSDHALEPPVYEEAESDEIEAVFKKALGGSPLTKRDIAIYKTRIMVDLGKRYAELGWAMQLHMDAQRNNNTNMFKKLGADTGYDSISDATNSKAISQILDSMEREGKLPKTILYSLNPNSDDVLATMIGNFQGGGTKGKMQFGSAWWFNDTKTGMQKQMTALANLGLLSRFVGMLTDSRSFLSYTRHEYFRRVMINLIAGWVENGEFPEDMEKLTEIVRNISYFNALNYFNFGGTK